MKALSSIVLFFARLCLASIFIFGGASKVVFYEQTAQFMASKGMGAVHLFLIAAAIIELAGGLSLILGYRTRLCSAVLILYLIPVTIIFHSFWDVTGAEQAMAQIEFFKNLAIGGGLLYVLCCGSGGCGLDTCCCKSKPPEQK
ncbi:MAG: DoxX family protein [Parachlamydiaceae bacterium]